LKIAHLTSVHGPFDTRIFHKECISLAKAEYEVHLVVGATTSNHVDGVQIHGVTTKVGGRLKRMLSTVYRVYRKALEVDASIYHLHDPELIPIGLLLKRRGKIVIFDSHEDYPADIRSKKWIHPFFRRPISWAFSRLEHYAYPKLDAVVVVHEELANRISRIQPSTAIVHNFPVIDSQFHPKMQRNRRFLWLGMLNSIRGSAQIGTAITGIDNITLDVIGPIGGDIALGDRIRVLGSFPQHVAMEMAAYYLAGLVTYLPEPNHIDALPNKLFEYMALGLPVIASNFPKWRRIVEDSNCGLLVDPTKPSEIAEAMLWMYQNPEKALEMGLRGREAVLRKYSWESEEKMLLDTYRSCLENHNNSRR